MSNTRWREYLARVLRKELSVFCYVVYRQKICASKVNNDYPLLLLSIPLCNSPLFP